MDVFSLTDYRQLAEFRHRIRQYLHLSERAARANGIEPQQHQLMLAIKGLPEGTRPTVTALSEQLCLKHHSTVELVNRLVKRGAAMRRQSAEDRREVFVDLTPLGEEILAQLAALHSEELRKSGPALSAALAAIAASAASAEQSSS